MNRQTFKPGRTMRRWLLVPCILLIIVLLPGLGWYASKRSNSNTSVNQAQKIQRAMSPTQGQAMNQKPVPMRFVRHGSDVTIDMYTEETTVTIAPGTEYHAWTFDGTVPGPVIDLQQGDHVTLHLHNLDPNMAHSIDLHAAMVAPNSAFTSVPPGGAKTIHFTANIPGVFLYHCASEPMLVHMANGMYGAVVVTPKDSTPPTFTIVQSEWYQNGDYNRMLNDEPQYVVFNGEAERYIMEPLRARVGQPITIAFVNAGPNEFSAFHIVGTILQTAEASGNPQNQEYNVQTVAVPPGDGYLFKVTFNEPGTYSFVSHAMNSADKGAMGEVIVTR